MSFDIICFDCDSTLSKIEGIDELGRVAGLFDELAALTHAAMNGELALEAVYGKRLELIKPSRADVTQLADLYIDKQVNGAKTVFNALLAEKKQIYIISGGLRQAILPLAETLGLAAEQVYAVDIFFDGKGCYRGFDQQSPLARTGGKAVICQQLTKTGQSMVMVGDGQTDLEAKAAGATMIGFGGVVSRALVKQQADTYLEGSLTKVLPYLLSAK